MSEREDARRLHSAIDDTAHEFSDLGFCGECERIQRALKECAAHARSDGERVGREAALAEVEWIKRQAEKAQQQRCTEPGCNEPAPPYCQRHRGDWIAEPALAQADGAER